MFSFQVYSQFGYWSAGEDDGLLLADNSVFNDLIHEYSDAVDGLWWKETVAVDKGNISGNRIHLFRDDNVNFRVPRSIPRNIVKSADFDGTPRYYLPRVFIESGRIGILIGPAPDRIGSADRDAEDFDDDEDNDVEGNLLVAFRHVKTGRTLAVDVSSYDTSDPYLLEVTGEDLTDTGNFFNTVNDRDEVTIALIDDTSTGFDADDLTITKDAGPTNVRQVLASSTAVINIAWDPVPDAVRYIFDRRSYVSGSTTEFVPITSRVSGWRNLSNRNATEFSFATSSLPSNTFQHAFRIRAEDSDGNFSLSSFLIFISRLTGDFDDIYNVNRLARTDTSLTYRITRKNGNTILLGSTGLGLTFQYSIRYTYREDEDYRPWIDITDTDSFTISNLEDGVPLSPGTRYDIKVRRFYSIYGEANAGETRLMIGGTSNDMTLGSLNPPTDLAITLEDVGSSGRVPNLLLNFTRNPGANYHQWRARSGSSSFNAWQVLQDTATLPFMPTNAGGTPFPSNVTTVFEVRAANNSLTFSNAVSITHTP